MAELHSLSDDALTVLTYQLYQQKMRLEVGGLHSFGGRELLAEVDRQWKSAQAERVRREHAIAAE